MIYPNKAVRYEESTVYKMLSILKIMKHKHAMSLMNLYRLVSKSFLNINEFIEAMNILYVLDVLELDKSGGVSYNARSDKK